MTNKEESFFLEFIKTILPYKWSIMGITILGMLLSALYLYFQPSIYEAQAIIKVKTNNNQAQRINELNPLGDLGLSSAGDVDQELAILQTFHIHDKAIEKLNLKVQYFIKKNYKKSEIFSNAPIKVRDITILEDTIIGKDIILSPKNSGFDIIIEKYKYKHFFNYGKEVKTKWFTCVIDKDSNFNTPIYFKLNGSNRNIYEKIIKKNFKATRLNENASLIKITYQDNSPARATSYLNDLMDIYIKQSIINKSKRNNKVLDFINQQLVMTGKALKESENQLENYRIKNNIIEPTRQSESLINRLSDVEVQLSQIKIEKKLIDNMIQFVRHNRNLDSITPTLRELGDEPTIRVIENLQDLRRRANELRIEFTPKHPQLKAVYRDINANKRTILANIKNLKKNIVAKERNLLNLKKKYEKSLQVLPTKEKQLVDMQRNHEVSSKMYSYLLEKKSENEMRKVATVSDYEIIDRAYSNGKPIKPKRAMNLSIATIFSLIFASLLAYMRHRLMNRLQNIKEIKDLTPLPIYAELPILKNNKLLNKKSPLLMQSFRNFRTKINFNHPKQMGNVILITSSKDRESKSTIVANLGYIFQKADYKTLIIDFDLYNPKLHDYFNLQLGSGVSEYLDAKENNIDKIIQHTAHPNLDVITAGSTREDASELILSRRLFFFIEILKKRYNYIFIDAIPLRIEADVLYIMKYSDVNLITVQEGLTKKSFISNIQKSIGEYKFKNIALLAVTNSVDN
ncbi:MAG: polysaccharide biosynthesis tyrosine autokinase [Epsilonproteobacteria bacterium]|nr:polysaccharide biosynthesis tyrosine autokinase [Campylobacterota bacterium]